MLLATVKTTTLERPAKNCAQITVSTQNASQSMVPVLTAAPLAITDLIVTKVAPQPAVTKAAIELPVCASTAPIPTSKVPSAISAKTENAALNVLLIAQKIVLETATRTLKSANLVN